MCYCAIYPRFYRDDSVLYDVFGEYCDDEAWPQIFMAGEMTNGRNDEGCISSESLFNNIKYY